jgi:hypothetical protein
MTKKELAAMFACYLLTFVGIIGAVVLAAAAMGWRP